LAAPNGAVAICRATKVLIKRGLKHFSPPC
jgi:hypothetical protein